MAKKKKSWREKVNEIEEKIHVITPEYEKRYGKGKILIASAVDIERVVRTTEKGELLTHDVIREKLAKDKGVQVTDPMTVGLFMRIIAEAAEEERAKGLDEITPYWRVLKPDGSINIKYPGGEEEQLKVLQAEGHQIVPAKGKKPPKVEGYKEKLKKFDFE